MNTYEAYLNHEAGNILKMEDALSIYTDMIHSFNECKLEDKMEYWNDFLKKALGYTTIRCQWETMTREQRIEADKGRTMKHDAMITALNILSRIAENEGIDNSWRERLGEERKRIGDFACFVVYMTGISNR